MYRVGDRVDFDVEFAVDGTPTDPATVTAQVELPDATVQPITPEKLAVGHYRLAFTAATAGQHAVSCTGTGAAASTHAEVFNVHPARPRALASLAELKAHLNMTDTQHDDELRAHLEAATDVVEQHVGQVVVRRAITGERHRVHRGSALVLDRVPVLSLTSVATQSGSTTWAADEVDLDPITGEVRPVEDGRDICGDLVVDYVAGYAVVPQNMVLAALIIAGHLYELQRPATPGISTGFPGDASLEPGVFGFAIPNRALELLGGRPPAIA